MVEGKAHAALFIIEGKIEIDFFSILNITDIQA